MIDFTQPSTWRGIVGLAGLIGWTLTPELRDQIAATLAAALSLIEMFRNEYRARPRATGGENRSAVPDRAGADPVELRDVPSDDPRSPPPGFGDR